MSSVPRIKVMTVVGTRPEIIKLSAVIKELDQKMDHILVHTGQNYDYELNEIFFKDLGLRKPDHFLDAAKGTSAETVANAITKVDELLEIVQPEAFLILGDTNSCMSAYAAKRRKIPIFHMEAGNRCFDMRVPEELNRRLLDHMSDINLVYSDVARHNLLREGLPMDRIIKSGSPTYEVLQDNLVAIKASDVVSRLGLEGRRYFVLSAHREENIGIERNFQRLLSIIELVHTTYGLPIIFSVHPRTRKKLETAKITLPDTVISIRPLGLFDYVNLQMNAFCVLSDSGTISEESSMLNFPAVNIRETHERIEAMDESSVIMAGMNPERVVQAIEMAKSQKCDGNREYRLPPDYSYPNVSKKVVRVIASYIDYVQRVVWSK